MTDDPAVTDGALLHLGTVKRFWLALTIVAAAACFDVSGSVQTFLVVSPILDSLFVGDTVPPRTVTLVGSDGVSRDPGVVWWSINPTSVAKVDSVSGKIVGVSKGSALLQAHAAGVTSPALVVVYRPLDLTLLMDTVIVLPDDTLSLGPYLGVKQKVPSATTLAFDSSAFPSVYTIDTTTGVITAHGTGGPVRYVARLSDGTHTVADTGAVVVYTLADTNSPGHFFMTTTGTSLLHQGGPAIALNYLTVNGFRRSFRLTDSLTTADGSSVNKVIVTLKDSVTASGTFDIDSLNPEEAGSQISAFTAYCNPPRPWGYLDVSPTSPTLLGYRAYSHATPPDSLAGHLVITQYATAVGGGAIISGRFTFVAQRTDLYTDPAGVVVIRSTFVAPLRQRDDVCQG